MRLYLIYSYFYALYKQRYLRKDEEKKFCNNGQKRKER